MIILTVKTDSPIAELRLWRGDVQLAELCWEAHRQLADTIHVKIEELLKTQRLGWDDIGGIAVYKGPGSFTGLRIGMSVANALAYSLHIPIVAQTGDDWLSRALTKLQKGENEQIVLPEYGGEAHITAPKK